MKIDKEEHETSCGECCEDAKLWRISFWGADGSIYLCAKCLLTLQSITSPLSILVQTGKDISNTSLDSET